MNERQIRGLALLLTSILLSILSLTFQPSNFASLMCLIMGLGGGLMLFYG